MTPGDRPVARVPFVVQHLVFCTGISYPDRRRPYRDSTLDGVDYEYAVPASAEFPYEPDEFWLFVRLYGTSDRTGDTRPLSVTCAWLDAPGGELTVWTRPVGVVPVRRPRDVVDRAWAFRPGTGGPHYQFPGLGRYVFRLWHPRQAWPTERVVAREYIRIERRP